MLTRRPPPLPTTAQIFTLRKLRDKVFIWTGEPVYVLVHMVGDGAKALPRPCAGDATCVRCQLAESEPARWWLTVPIVIEQPSPDRRSCRLEEGVATLPLGVLGIFKDYGGTFRGRRCQLRASGNRTVRVDHELGELKVPAPVSVLEVFCDRWGYAREQAAIESYPDGRQVLCFDLQPGESDGLDGVKV